MSVMTQVSEALYPAILRVLRKHSGGIPPEELVTSVSNLSGASTREVKRAIWELIAQQEVAFSSEQMLLPAGRSSSRTGRASLGRHRSR
jgi:hypothetical protein